MLSNKSFTRSVRENLKKIGIGLIAVILIGLFFVMQKPGSKTQNQATPQKIAITQIAPHPSLDAIRQGITDVLVEKGIPKNNILFENAMGNIATATQIAQKFISEDPAVIVPITTTSTQAAYVAAKTKAIPIIFSGVSDPVSAKLIPSMQETGELITGVSDLSPLDEQLDLMKKLLPELKSLGILYNPGEANSMALLSRLEKKCTELTITLIKAPVSSTVEAPTATRTLIGKVEAIYIPTDNTVASALDAVIQVAKANNVPLFCADPESVGRGCLASLAHNQYQLGRQTGEMILRFLTDQKLPQPEYGIKLELTINIDSAKQLGITIPDDVLKKASQLYKDGEKHTTGISAVNKSQRSTRSSLWPGIEGIWNTIKGIFIAKPSQSNKPKEITIGIIQVVEHPALDQTRAGIIDTLKKKGIKGNIQWQSAQGSPPLALQIAQSYMGQNVSVIVTIATNPTQMALAAAKGTNTPIVFASVTDPVGAKLFTSSHPITGVSNYIDVEPQVNCLKSILARDHLLIGVIYNPSEANSVTLVEKMKDLSSQRKDITWVWAPAGKTNDVAQAAETLVDQVDAIFINNDNTALAAFESIVKVAQPHRIPVFCSDVDMVGKGALAALGPNQYELGIQAGEMIIKVLEGDTSFVQNHAVNYPRKVETHLDLDMAKSIGLMIPKEIVQKADRVLPIKQASRSKTVAIIQFVEHPALDIEREAIINTLKKEFGEELTIHYQNAQGNVATATQIATQLASKKPDVLIAIATPAAQAALVEAKKLNIPLVFTAVTDPVQAKLVKDLNAPDPLATGVSDVLPVEKQLELIRKMIPNLKTLGIIYNPGEINAVIQVEQLQKMAGNLKIILSPASQSSGIATATENLVGRVEAILIPNSNTVASAIESAVSVATKHDLPLFAMDVDLVDRGVLAAVGYDRTQLGMKAGQLTCSILKGTAISTLKVQSEHLQKVKVNKEIAQKIGIKLDNDLHSLSQGERQ